MTSDHIVSDITSKAIDRFIKQPHHALLIIGEPGIGKKTIADVICKQILTVSNLNETSVLVITADTSSIGIDQIREVKNFLKLKTAGKNMIRRAVIIENGNLMTNEAQNSLLKLLEEPPEDTILIITSPNEQSLRPTIVSRCHVIKITKPNLEQVLNYFNKKGFSDSLIKSNYLLSNGTPGLIFHLLTNQDSDSLAKHVADIKYLLKSSKLDKLILVDKLAKDKENINDWIYALKRICDAGLKNSISGNAQRQSDYWLKCLKAATVYENEITKGSNLKLSLSKLLLEL